MTEFQCCHFPEFQFCHFPELLFMLDMIDASNSFFPTDRVGTLSSHQTSSQAPQYVPFAEKKESQFSVNTTNGCQITTINSKIATKSICIFIDSGNESHYLCVDKLKHKNVLC